MVIQLRGWTSIRIIHSAQSARYKTLYKSLELGQISPKQWKTDNRYGTGHMEPLYVLATDDSHKKERNHLEDLGIDGRIILKSICKETGLG